LWLHRITKRIWFGVLVRGPEGRPETHQQQMRDGQDASFVPGGLIDQMPEDQAALYHGHEGRVSSAAMRRSLADDSLRRRDQQVGQLRDVDRDASGFVARESFAHFAEVRVIIEVDVTESLPVGVADHEALTTQFLDRPRRRWNATFITKPKLRSQIVVPLSDFGFASCATPRQH
jgi:hypothetical protein